jgi:hypothetical protein
MSSSFSVTYFEPWQGLDTRGRCIAAKQEPQLWEPPHLHQRELASV